jgi:hypothetical protein
MCFHHAGVCTTGAAAQKPGQSSTGSAFGFNDWFVYVRFPNPEATPELSWILQVWFSDPSSRHVELVAVAELPVFDSGNIALIPQAGELQVGQAVRMVPESRSSSQRRPPERAPRDKVRQHGGEGEADNEQPAATAFASCGSRKTG